MRSSARRGTRFQVSGLDPAPTAAIGPARRKVGRVLAAQVEGLESRRLLAFNPSLAMLPVSAVERTPLTDVPIASIQGVDNPADAATLQATINWGDGTVEPASIDSLGQLVLGSHTYRESGSYRIEVAIRVGAGPDLDVESGVVQVQEVPLGLSGRLDAGSDTGESNSDGITALQQPTFSGTSEPGSLIRVYAQADGGSGPLLALGDAAADANGEWRLTSQLALADGRYSITVFGVDANGVTTAQSSGGEILVDTVAPRISALTYSRADDRIIATILEGGSGLGLSRIGNKSAYRLDRLPSTSGNLGIESVSLSPYDPASGTQAVTIQGARGALKSGSQRVTIVSGPAGIADLAGNALDGEFYGGTPSGNNIAGGDFIAILDPARPAPQPNAPDTGGEPESPWDKLQERLKEARREAREQQAIVREVVRNRQAIARKVSYNQAIRQVQVRRFYNNPERVANRAAFNSIVGFHYYPYFGR